MKPEELESGGLEREEQAANVGESSLIRYLNARSGIGLTKMVADLALEPQGPFKPDAPRTFRKGFVIAVLFSAAFAAWFVWFNLIR